MNQDFFEQLQKRGININEKAKQAIIDKINSVLSYEPRVGVFGKTGVGKSSLCNALFGADLCEISDVSACTRNPQEVLLKMGQKGLKLIDVPGVGESSDRDEEYKKLYAKLLPELDLVLWVIKGDDRALTSDETFYKDIVKPHITEGKAFFFVLNQVDKIQPFQEWDRNKHEPSPKQFQNIHRKIDDLILNFGVRKSQIIPISANEKYNLTGLVDEIVFALPKDKLVTLTDKFKEEHLSDKAKDKIKKSFTEVIGDVIDGAINIGRKIIDVIKELPPIPWPWKWPF